MNIVGVSSHYHDSAACLMSDGVLVAAAQEERFSRRKNDPRVPRNALRYCIEAGGLSITDIDCVAYYENPVKRLERQLWTQLPRIRETAGGALAAFDAARPLREIREALGYSGSIRCYDHHLSHAASAYFFSGFADAAVLTVDAVGEWASATYGRGSGAELSVIEQVNFPDSLGLLYSTLTAYLGFSVNDDEYKVMGLAPYGEPRYLEAMRRLAQPGADGRFHLDLEFFDFASGGPMHTDRLSALLGKPPRVPESEIEPFHCDVARSLQVHLEECLLAMVRHLHGVVGGAHLCMAGGVALNCVANGRILREGPFERLFVQPAAGDAGGCLGAAAMAHRELTGTHPVRERLVHVYYGPGADPGEIAGLLEDSEAGAQDFRGREAELLEATVDRLARGEVVGWFQGRMEFGPRALGARSILADPRRPEMRDVVNSRVKQRESFRPFAPAVLASHAGEHFELDHDSPFMLETCRVTSPLELPAITHVDRSARVQTVDPGAHPRFAALLHRFHERTGCPVLLNTSFNMRGQPIVRSPLDALVCFLQSRLDCLVLGDFLIDRFSVPESWFERYGYLETEDRLIPAHVYTFL
jgi:carbamoyltransferase